MDNCPICGFKRFRYISFSEYGWGTVEQHGSCDRCGYVIEQAYSDVVTGFLPMQKKGCKDARGVYHKKNCRKRKRMKRKFNIKYGNKDWALALI